MSSANDNTTLIKELTDLILKGNAHAALEDAVADIPLADLTKSSRQLALQHLATYRAHQNYPMGS